MDQIIVEALVPLRSSKRLFISYCTCSGFPSILGKSRSDKVFSTKVRLLRLLRDDLSCMVNIPLESIRYCRYAVLTTSGSCLQRTKDWSPDIMLQSNPRGINVEEYLSGRRTEHKLKVFQRGSWWRTGTGSLL